MAEDGRRQRVRRITARAAAGVLAVTVVATAHATSSASESTDAGPIFEDGQAQVVPEFSDPDLWIREQLWVETESDSDGDGQLDRVHVDVTRPLQTDTEDLDVPVVYETSPYYAGTASVDSELTWFWDVQHEIGAEPPPRKAAPEIPHRPDRTSVSNSHVEEWVPRGFAVVHSDSPGTGLSQGCPTIGGVNESLAPKAVVDWLNGRAKGYTSVDGDEEIVADWTTGKVGMTGTSYNGTLPIAAAATGVEGLEAIVPVAAISEWYEYYRSNGAIRHPGGGISPEGTWRGEDADVLYDFINSGFPERRDYCNDTVRDAELMAGVDRTTGDYNEFWGERSYVSNAADITAATLFAHGFNDWNVMPEQATQLYKALRERGTPVQAYFHQGGHGGPPPHEMMNRWFTRYLWGHENGVENDPRVQIAHGSDRFDTTPYDDYPNPDSSPVTLNVQRGGETEGGLTSLALPDETSETLEDDWSHLAGELAQEDSSDHRLLYTTPELGEDLHLSGSPTLTVRVSSSAPAANLSAMLVRLPWTGSPLSTASVVTRGWADPQNHSSLTAGEELEPGTFYEVTFDLQATDKIVSEGQQLGLMIFSSDREYTLRPEPGTELTVDLAASSLELPVVGGPLAMPICEDEDTRDTVVINGVDSGVPNHTLAGVCTINDHILDGEEWRSHGQFVRHVAEVAEQLRDAGIIEPRERGALMRAAASSPSR
ncbi:Xaa-Pro dipeptidyl-peptidase [Actinobacteria bacterium YIM 96077]|uniref:Xaa-Pro dipeptidyl-peptidase n=1 Tax=Phytoactinopolyspora halophila TaxID=1981511 RepID=A0A329R0S4_9ACTN|nr:Xaa-Pro dipeptidyl-peptidase [Phytoactinopolyspora halophila]AYY15191.1 Xaa-Pro dipeptidyl-peptidase [Actinobacteria bacterium YIM 96077]RAW18137.1 Xaa-Pro dipeptidyl-peptidase [Phytoactinopolyspora halophila]